MSSRVNIKIHGILGNSAQRKVFLAFAPAQVLHRLSFADVLDEDTGLPQLIIIDGGKGQLSAAVESINELGLQGKTTVIGLAKNEEEIFFPGDKESLKLDYRSESLKLIRQIRNEVHRFGITFHRKKRSAGTFKNELEDIPGIGKATANSLLKTFKSVKNIRAKTQEELQELVGASKAKMLIEYFRQKEEGN